VGETTRVARWARVVHLSGHDPRQGLPLPRVRVLVRRRTGFGASMTISGGPNLSGPPSGPQRSTGITREDGSYELLEEPGEASLSVETLDGKTTLLSRAITVPDVEAHPLDVALAGVTVSGVVVDQVSGKPLAEARVSAWQRRASDRGGFYARTGSDGRFTLELEAGAYRLTTQADAYNEDRREMTVADEGATDLRIALDKGVAIVGRVLDGQGRPAAGARVSAVSLETQSRAPEIASTLADGSFRLEGLERKPYTLLAGSSQGFALRADVAAGVKDLVLTLQPGGKARVHVVEPGGEPASGAFVGLVEVGGTRVMNPLFGERTDAQGVVVMDLPAGTVVLFAGKERAFGRTTATVAPGATAAARIQLETRPAPSPRP
jgi:protocatechuate 3,4-dioxygenase beta subunit